MRAFSLSKRETMKSLNIVFIAFFVIAIAVFVNPISRVLGLEEPDSGGVGSADSGAVDAATVTKALDPTAELRVNTGITGSQRFPAVGASSDDVFLIVWQSPSSDGDGLGIVGQRYSLDVGLVGAEIPINSVTSSAQRAVAVSAAADGWWVAWESESSTGTDSAGESIQLRRVDSMGLQVATDIQVNTTIVDRQRAPALDADAAGNLVVVWQSESSAGTDTANWSVQLQRFNAAGVAVGGEMQVNETTAGSQHEPDVDVRSTGEFVVVWRGRSEIYARRFAADGMALGSEIMVNDFATDTQRAPAVAINHVSGDFVVVWQSTGADGSGESVRMKAFQSDGTPKTPELSAPSVETGDQVLPDVVMEEAGFTVVWTDVGRDGDGSGIYARRFDVEGNPLDVDFRVHTETIGDQDEPAIGASLDGDLFVAWEGQPSTFGDTSGWGILGRAFLKTRADLNATINADRTTLVPGDAVSFTIEAANSGADDVVGAEVMVTFPVELTPPGWDCTPSVDASCMTAVPDETAAGTGDISLTVDFESGRSVDISADSSVGGGTPPGVVSGQVGVSGVDVVDPDDMNDVDSVELTIMAADFGDAPADYPVAADKDGARHLVDGVRSLGFNNDAESDGQPDGLAEGEAVADDGIAILSDGGDLVICSTATLEATILAPAATSVVFDGWVDYDSSRDWEADERVLGPAMLMQGIHDLDFMVPCDVPEGDPIFARFRVSTLGSADATGRAEDGEVEDYAFRVVAISDIGIHQSLDTAPTPGTTLEFTITAVNNGPSPAVAAVSSPYAMLTDVSWICDDAGGGQCSAAGPGGLVDETVILDPGTSVEFSVSGDLAASATGMLDNTATITLAGGTDPDPANNSSRVLETIVPVSDLQITKGNGQDYAVINDLLTYQVVVQNAGPSDSLSALVSDALDELDAATWTCGVTMGNGSCVAGSPAGTGIFSNGNISQSVDLPVGAQLQFTISGTARDVAPADGNIVNTATVAATTSTDPVPGNNSATDTDPVIAVDYGDAPDCVTQPDCGPPAYATLLENDGARHRISSGIYLGSIPDAEIDGEPTASADGDGPDEDGFVNRDDTELITCEPAYMDISAIVDSSVGSVGYLNAWIDFDHDGDFGDAGEHIFGGAALALSTGLHNDLQIDVPCGALPGSTFMRLRFSTTEILGPSGFAGDGEVEDYPVEIFGLDFGDADCGHASCVQSYETLLIDNGARHLVRGGEDLIHFGAGIDTESSPAPAATADSDDLSGIDDEDGIVFLDTSLDPDSTSQVQITVSDSCDVELCFIQAWVDFNTNGVFGNDEKLFTENTFLTGGVHVLGFTVPPIDDPGKTTVARFRIGTDKDELQPKGRASDGEVEDHTVDLTPVANLTVLKHLVGAAIPGGRVQYDVLITNPGPNDVSGATVLETPPPELTNLSWTCVHDVGVDCTADPLPALPGALTGTVDLPVGATATFTLEGDLSAAADTTLHNEVRVTVPDGVLNLAANDPDDPGGRSTAFDESDDDLSPHADVSVTVNDGLTAAIAGAALSFNVTVMNAGPSDAPAALLTHSFFELNDEDVLWVCTPSGGAEVPPFVNGLLNLTLNLPVGSSLSCQVDGNLLSSAMGSTQNVVTIDPGDGFIDLNPGDNSDADTDTVISKLASLALSKVDDADPVRSGEQVAYTVTVTNLGPSDAEAVVVDENLPVQLQLISSEGCAEDPAGDVSCTLGAIAAGEQRSFEILGEVDSAVTQLVTNSLTVSSSTPLNPPIFSDPDEQTCFYAPGGELPISRLTGSLSNPDLAAGPDGWVSVWQSTGGEGPDLDGSSIRLQRFDLDRVPVDDSIQVNVDDSGEQVEPAVAIKPDCLEDEGCSTAPDGSFVVVWAHQTGDIDDGFSILGRRFDADGTALGMVFQVNDYTTNDQRRPAVTMARDGSFMVAWDSLGSPGDDPFTLSVQGRVFEADGTPKAGQFQINQTVAYPQGDPDVAALKGEDPTTDLFVVVWESLGSTGDDQSGTSIQGRRYALDGTDLDPEIQINLTTDGDQKNARVASNSEGLFAVAWQSGSSGDPNGTDILFRRFNPNFTATNMGLVGDEVQANGDAAGDQENPDLVLGEDRNITVVWQSPDASGTGISRRSFSPDNVDFNGDTEVSLYDTGDQEQPAIAVIEEGDFLVVWQGPSSECRPAEAGISGRFIEVAKADLLVSIDAQIGDPVVVVPGDPTPLVLDYHADNLGPQNVEDALLNILIPEGMLGASWCCQGAPADCDALPRCPVVADHGTSPLTDVRLDIPSGNRVTFQVFGTFAADDYEDQEASASIAVGAGAADPEIGNNETSKPIDLDPQVALSITKSDGETAVVPGAACDTFETFEETGDGCLTYQIDVRNEDFSAAIGVAVVDDLADYLDCSWTCDADPEAEAGDLPLSSCVSGMALGTDVTDPDELAVGGIFNQRIDLFGNDMSDPEASGGHVRVSIHCEVLSTADELSGFISNTATLNVPMEMTDTDGTENNSATDNDTGLQGSADLWVELSGPDPTEPLLETIQIQEQFAFELIVANCGPSTARGVVASMQLPGGLVFDGSDSAGCVETRVDMDGTTHVECAIADAIAAEVCTEETELPTEGSETVLIYAYSDLTPAEVGTTARTLTAQTQVTSLDGDPVTENNSNDHVIELRRDFVIGPDVGDHDKPAVAITSTDELLVVWGGDLLDANESDIRLQRYSPDGMTRGPELVVNTYTTGNQGYPRIALGPNDEFMVVWESEGSAGNPQLGELDIDGRSIQARLFDSVGNPVGAQFQVNDEILENQRAPDVAAVMIDQDPSREGVDLSLEGFVVVWQGRADGEDIEGGIRGQWFSPTGTLLGGEMQINHFTEDSQKEPSVSVDHQGVAVVTWESTENENDEDGSSILARRFDKDRVAVDDADIQVNRDTPNAQSSPSVASMPTGEFLVAWESVSEVRLTDIRAQLFCRDARYASVDELALSSDDADLDQINPAISFIAEEDFILNWSSEDFGDGLRFDGPDAKVGRLVKISEGCVLRPGTESDVDSSTEVDLAHPDIVYSNGRYLSAWERGNRIYGRIADFEYPNEIRDADDDTVLDACDRCPLADDTVDTHNGGNGFPDCAEADLVVTKTLLDDMGLPAAADAGIVPGSTVKYLVEVTNNGPSGVIGALFEDLEPENVTFTSWKCQSFGNSSCVASGDIGDESSGSGDVVLDLRLDDSVNARIEIEIVAQVSASATGMLTNVATVQLPEPMREVFEDDNSAEDRRELRFEAALAVAIDNGVTEVVPAEMVTYSIVASNAGPSNVIAAELILTIPEDLEELVCRYSDDSESDPELPIPVDISVGNPVTVTCTGRVTASATGELVVSVELDPPADTSEENDTDNHASDTDAITPKLDLGVTKLSDDPDAGPGDPVRIVPGSRIEYAITVTNHGPIKAVNALVTDEFPSSLSGMTWQCTTTHGDSSCVTGMVVTDTGQQTGNISALVDIGVGENVQFIARGTIDPTARGALINTVQALPPMGVDDPDEAGRQPNVAMVEDTLVPVADLEIHKDDGETSVVAGESTTYVIEVTNNGPSHVFGATVTDVVPNKLEDATWQCTNPTATNTCDPTGSLGNLNSDVDLEPGGSLRFELDATVKSNESGEILNIARVAVPEDGTVDEEPGNDSSSDLNVISLNADVSITKTDGLTVAVPGESLTYTLVVANAGPSIATNVRVRDVLPGTLTCPVWTCVPEDDPSCPGGDNSIDNNEFDELVDLPVDSEVTFRIDCDISPSATGTLTNIATASPQDSLDLNPLNNTATDSDTELTPEADLEVTKTNDGEDVHAGGSVSYTIVVTNHGPSDAPVTQVSDDLEAILVGPTWTCTSDGASACSSMSPDLPPQNGSIFRSVNLPVGSSVTFEVDGGVPGNCSDTLTNNVTVMNGSGEDNGTEPNEASQSNECLLRTDLYATINDNSSVAVPGEMVTYQITVGNHGEGDAEGATVQTAVEVGALSNIVWDCGPAVGSIGALCQSGVSAEDSGNGHLSIQVDIPANEELDITLTGTIPPGTTGDLDVKVAVTAVGDADLTDGNNMAIDSNDLTPKADISITKTSAHTSVLAGETVGYQITVANPQGPSDARGVTLSDDFLGDLTLTGCSCTPNGATCPGACPLDNNWTSTVDLPKGSSLTFDFTATVSSGTMLTSLPNTTSISIDACDAEAVPTCTVEEGPLPNSSTTPGPSVEKRADLYVSFASAGEVLEPGDMVSYTVTAGNHGPSDVMGADVAYMFPEELESISWDCVATDPAASCKSGSSAGTSLPDGTGIPDLSMDIAQAIGLPAGSFVTFTVNATVKSATPGGALENTVSIGSDVEDLIVVNDTATRTDTIQTVADLSITKTAIQAEDAADGEVTFTLVVSNDPSSQNDILGATVTDVFDETMFDRSTLEWTCEADPGAGCTPGIQTTDISDSVDLPIGTSITYTVTVTVKPDVLVTNQASITMPDGQVDTNPANNSVIIDVPVGDLSITQEITTETVETDEIATITLTVSNSDLSPNNMVGARVENVFDPAVFTMVSWSCEPEIDSGASCVTSETDETLSDQPGDIDQLIDLPIGTSVTFEATAIVNTGMTVANTATVTVPSGLDEGTRGSVDTFLENNTVSSDLPIADLSILKEVASIAEDNVVTFTITAGNSMDSLNDITGASVSDVFDPLQFATVTWECAADPGALCVSGMPGEPTSDGSGDIDELVDLPIGTSVTFTVTATPTLSAEIVNEATVSVPEGAIDTDASNNSSSVTVPIADLSIVKELTSIGENNVMTFTITADNSMDSLSDITGASVSDVFDPTQFATVTWECAADPGAFCVSGMPGEPTSNGSGNIDALVDLPIGTSVTFIVTATPAIDATVIENTATVSVPDGAIDIDDSNDSSTVGLLVADLSVTNTPDSTTVGAGNSVTFTMTVENPSEHPIENVSVHDDFNALSGLINLTTLKCTPPTGGTCELSGDNNAVMAGSVNLGANEALSFSVTARVLADATGMHSNTVDLGIPPGVFDPNGSNNTAIAEVTVEDDQPETPFLEVIKDHARENSVEDEHDLVYTFSVTNTTSAAIAGVDVTDTLPGVLLSFMWTCAAEGGMTCRTPSGTENIVETDLTFPVGGKLTYVINATVSRDELDICNTVVVKDSSERQVEANSCDIFADGFESGDTSAWSSAAPAQGADDE